MLIETRKPTPKVARINEAFLGIYVSLREGNPAKHDAYQEALDAASNAAKTDDGDDIREAVTKLERAREVAE